MKQFLKNTKTLAGTILLIALCCKSGSLISQDIQLNQYDKDHKKSGKWIVYLDENWKRTEDSSTALFKRFSYFEKGKNIYPMGPCGGTGYSLLPAIDPTAALQMLDGEYSWYDEKGKLSSVHVFKKGEYVSCKEYSGDGKLKQFFDYSKKCEGQSQGWTAYLYDKNGNVKETLFMCKDKKGNWPPTRD